jgi:hypothetical protein
MRVFLRLALLVMAAMPAACASVLLQAGAVQVSVQPEGVWTVSFTILNRGDHSAKQLKISEVSVHGANMLTRLPLEVGEVPAAGAETRRIQLGVHRTGRLTFELSIEGIFVEAGRPHSFSLRYTLANF